MRKIFVAITTLAMALVMSLSSLFGCKLITTNTESDMNQVVATVQSYPDAPKETVYKKDILVDYYNYLYQATGDHRIFKICGGGASPPGTSCDRGRIWHHHRQ